MRHRTIKKEDDRDPQFSAKKRPTREIVRRVGVYLKPYKLMASATIACAVLQVVCSFVFPKLTQWVIDEVIARNRAHLLGPAMLGLLGAFFMREVFNSLRVRINNVLEQRVIYDMRCQLYAKLQRLPVNYFDQRASGDLMTRVVEDVNNLERILIDGTETAAVAFLSVFGVLVILLYMNPALALVALAPVPFLAAGAIWYTLTAHRRYRVQREAASAMNALLMDNLQGVRQIKAFGREGHEDGRFAERADETRRGMLEIMLAWAWYNPAMIFTGATGVVLVLWFGGRQVMAGGMTLGELMGFILYLGLFYEPIGRLHGLNQMLQSARAAGERVFDILDTESEGRTGARDVSLVMPVRGDVVYERVAFHYQDAKTVLQGVSLHARPGEIIALVGPTGAGKSTVVNLLPAFYEPAAGRILIDGQDIGRVRLDSLRAQISVVSQEPFLFNGTIRENILYGKLDATEAELNAAAEAANCREFIGRLPQGYEARVGERGVKLSVGEKQRVSIARALLKNTPLLILDEATASVDTATERLIQEALERLMARRTSFVIAHRLSTIRKAHQILVLNHGQIIERGSHDDLMAQNGLYARLARIQNTTFIEEGFEKLAAAP